MTGKEPGSVWQRKDGRFGAELPYPALDPVTGRIVTKTAITTRSTRESAEGWLAERREELLTEEVLAGTQALGEYLEGWLRDVVAPGVAPRTFQKREWAVKTHIAPALGNIVLNDLGPRDIQALYASLSREGYSHETRRQIHVTLKMALKQALRWGLLRHNPADMVDAPRGTRTADENGHEDIRHLTDVQVQRLFETRGRWRNYYVVAVRTGLRPGEMLALRWQDVDTEGDPGPVRVRRTLDTHYAPVFGPPKSPASRRTVALHVEAKDALLAQRWKIGKEGLSTGPKDLVFPSVDGAPMRSNNLRRRGLQPDLARLGLPELTLHELRHTFASIMLHEWLVPPAIVSQMLGHRSIAFTFDLYGHLIPTAQADVMRRLNASHNSPSEGASETG